MSTSLNPEKGGDAGLPEGQSCLHDAFRARMVASSANPPPGVRCFKVFSPLFFSFCSRGGNELRQSAASLILSSIPSSHTLLIYS